MPLDSSIIPTEEQREALTAIEQWYNGELVESTSQTFLLDGGAGTGKTTIARLAVERLNLKKVVFGAYTAKAARVMRQKGMEDASTLHRLLYRPRASTVLTASPVWIKQFPYGPCSVASLIVLDECSFVDEKIAADLLEFETPVLILGDVEGQLPPIKGQGAFTNRRPDFRLLEIHRTAEANPINRFAWNLRNGHGLRPHNEPGLQVSPLNTAAWDNILNREYQVICGKHKSRLAITRRARAHFGFTSPMPQPGEPLICRRNNYNIGFLNGDTATVWQIEENDERRPFIVATLLTDEGEREGIPIWRGLFNSHAEGGVLPEREARTLHQCVEMDWAYAITAHSAQGSEWPRVIVIDDHFMSHDRDLRRRWLYTACTRASEELIVYTTG